jgi:hypothetical protein
MKKLIPGRPSPAMLIAVIALVFALAGTAVAAKTLGLSALSNGAKNKTVGVGKLTYVTTTIPIPANTTTPVQANCPAGLRVIGGGVKWATLPAPDTVITDSHPTTTGWGGHVYSGINNTATTTAICAASRVVTGAPPATP